MRKLLLLMAACFTLGIFFYTFAQESITFTTYYPSPYGAYNNLSANIIKYGNLTMASTDCTSANEGMTFYGTVTGIANKNLFVCNGTSWTALIEESNSGYTWGGIRRQSSFVNATGSVVWYGMVDGNWELYGAPTKPSVQEVYGGPPVSQFRINYINQTSGETEFDWDVDIDVDQYGAGGTDGWVRMAVQQYDGSSWVNLDTTDNLYDTVLKTGVVATPTVWSGTVNVDWQNHPASETRRIFSKYYAKGGVTNLYRRFRIAFYKNLAAGQLRFRINSANLTIYRP